MDLCKDVGDNLIDVLEYIIYIEYMKICSKCKTEKPLNDFYISKKSKDGFSYWCNFCRKENVKKHRENPEYRKRQNEWNKKWSKDNPEKRREINRNSQRRINELFKTAGYITTEIRKIIYQRDNFLCLCCGTTENLSIDHIIPLSSGGLTIEDNLQTLCTSCNSRKQQQIIDYRNQKI